MVLLGEGRRAVPEGASTALRAAPGATGCAGRDGLRRAGRRSRPAGKPQWLGLRPGSVQLQDPDVARRSYPEEGLYASAVGNRRISENRWGQVATAADSGVAWVGARG